MSLLPISTSPTSSPCCGGSPRLRGERGSALIMVLHDVNLARRFCDHVLMLDHGAAIAGSAARASDRGASVEDLRRRAQDASGRAKSSLTSCRTSARA